MSDRMVGIFSTSLHCEPQPNTLARSLPVPSGTTPTMHWRGKEEREGESRGGRKREREGGREGEREGER